MRAELVDRSLQAGCGYARDAVAQFLAVHWSVYTENVVVHSSTEKSGLHWYTENAVAY